MSARSDPQENFALSSKNEKQRMYLLAEIMPIGMNGKRLSIVRIPYDEETTVVKLAALAQKMVDKLKPVIGQQEILTVRGEDGCDYFDDITVAIALEMSNKIIFLAIAVDKALGAVLCDNSCSS
jgi:hypothetical protein